MPLELLLIEDSERLREIATEMLRELGHTVAAAADAESGLAYLADHRCDAVITDISLPGMSGLELARVLAARWPSLPIVVSSGYADITAQLLKREFRRDMLILTKPYDIDTLEKVVNEAARLLRSDPV